jgi:hypothetical protein
MSKVDKKGSGFKIIWEESILEASAVTSGERSPHKNTDNYCEMEETLQSLEIFKKTGRTCELPEYRRRGCQLMTAKF